MRFPIKFLLAAVLLLSAFSSFSQVSNDDCAGAVDLQVSADATCDFNTIYGTTVNATASGLGECNPEASDVWYSFVATASVHFVHVLDVRYAYYYNFTDNFTLEIFSGNCNQLQHRYCVESDYGMRLGELIPGNTYYLRICNPYNRPITFYLCVSTPTEPPPANDACANAIALPVASGAVCETPVFGTTQNAAASPFGTPTSYYAPYEDVWYTFTATQANQIVTVNEVFDAAQINFSNVTVETYTGGCGNLVSMNRSADIYHEGSLVFNALTAGQTYYVRLSKLLSNTNPPVQFNICVTSPPPPPNDECTRAQSIIPDAALDCSGQVSGSLLGATSSGADCQAGAVNDVWYQFTAASPSQRVKLLSPGDSGYGFELYSGDCDYLASITCASGTDLARTFTNLTVGATYFLRIFSPTYTALEFQVCVLSLPLPPANDECAGALPLAINPGITYDLYTEGSTLGATSSLPACGSTENTHDVWYSFVATSVSQRILLSDNADIFGTWQQLGYTVYRGDCDHLTSLACSNTPPDYNHETLLGGLTPGDTYYIRVYSIAGSNHAFNLTLQTLPPPPANEDCAQAQTLTSASMPDCGTPVVGNTTGVVTVETSNCLSGKDLWYTFTATHLTHVLQITDVQTIFYYNSDYSLELYEGTDCSNLTYVRCYARPGKIYLNQLTVGKTYYLRWVSDATTAHSFQICLSHFDPPANDACANARSLTVHGNLNCYYPAPGNTAGSTAELPTGCLANADVWFRFTAIQTTQQIVVSNAKSVENGNFVPLRAELLAGNCGNLSTLYCWPQMTAAPFTLFVGDLIPGQTYYLRIASPDDIPVSFDVCALTPPKPPVNDNCAHATALIPEIGDNCASIYGTTQYATPTPGLPLPSGPVEGDVWYSFDASQATQVVSLMYVNGYNSNQVIVEVYASACGTFNLQATQTIANSGTVYLTNLTPGATYYVRVAPESSIYIGFYICISAPIPPVNDACASALPLPVNIDYRCDNLLDATTFGATQSQPGCDGSAVNDIWYQFTATDATYRFENPAYYPHSGGEGLEIFSGDCDHLVSLVCRTMPDNQPDVFQQGGFIPGNTYYVRLWSKSNTVQQWTLCIFALPAAPVNDDCVTATVLPVNIALPCAAPTIGTTRSATASQPTCSGGAVLDVWYTFTAASGSNLLNIDFTANYFGAYYAGYELFSGDCSAGNSLLCQEFATGNLQIVLPDLTPGQTYFLRIYNYNLQAQDFSICLTGFPVPPNDDCALATPVTANPDLHCTTVYAGTTGGSGFSAGFTTPDIWYTFTANNPALLFQLLNIQTLFGASNQLGYEIYHGTDCDNWQLTGTYDPTKQTRVNGLVPGDRYFIRVFSRVADAASSFDLCIQTPPPPPVNDDCAGALPLTVNATLVCDALTHGSTAGLVGYNGYGHNCYTSYYLHEVNDMWYTFTATSPNHIIQASNITPVTGADAGFFDLSILQSTDCVNFTTLACNAFDTKILVQGLTPGETYYVLANSGADVSHDFDLCVTTYPVPANDLCADAIPLPVAPTLTCGTPTAGTAVSASITGTPGCGNSSNGDVWYTFTATQAAQTIALTDVIRGIEGYANYFDVEVYAGNCGALQTLVCRSSQYYAVTFTVGDLIPGEPYYIRVTGDVNFNICISTPDLPPVNDACSGATALTSSPDEYCATPTLGTLEHATASNPGPSGNFGVNDVWYTFTATAANHAIVFNNMTSDSPDYLLAEMYAGTCGTLTKIEVQSYFLLDKLRYLATNLTPGTTYYIRVYDGSNFAGTFDICALHIAPPPNDACAAATPIIVNDDLTCQHVMHATTYGATQSVPGCTGDAGNDVWYQFTATTASCRLDINPTTYGRSYNYGVEILEGTCTAPTVVLPCTVYYYTQVLNLHDLVVGNTYYLRLFVPPADYKEFDICIRSLPDPPVNHNCIQATVIQPGSGVDCGQVYNGTTISATQSGVNCDGYVTDDVWYQFTATSTAHLITLLATTDPFGTNTYPGMEVYIGSDCANLTALNCSYYQYGNAVIQEGLTIGETYFIRVFTNINNGRNFSLCIGTIPAPAINSNCADAILVVPSPDMQCTSPVAGTTAGLTEVFYRMCNYYSYGTNLWYHFKATDYTQFIQLQNIVHQYGDPSITLALYQEGCDGSLLLYCTSEQEILATNLIPGTDYYIQVSGQLRAGTSFELCVLTPTQPSNDHCANAVVLPVSQTVDCISKVSGTTVGATGSYGIYCGDGPDVWYSFIATGTDHQINITKLHPLNSGYIFVEVLSGSDCDHLNEYIGCFNGANTIVNNLVPGKTYYLRLGTSYPGYVNFDICITSPQPDLDVRGVYANNNGCNPGNNESVTVLLVNTGSVNIAVNAAQFTLTVSGANNGIYGPIGNDNTLLQYYYYAQVVTFTGIDLSNPGQSHISVNAVLPNDLNVANNTNSQDFYSQPLITYYRDADMDGYGDAAAAYQDCTLPYGYSSNNSDCDDNANWIYPGAPEVCNGVDDDCDGLVDAADPGLLDAPVPNITCPANITQFNDAGTCAAVITYSVEPVDPCGFTVIQIDGLASGAAFPVGTTLNNFTASGPGGSPVSCSFTVTIQKTADPDLLYAYTIIGRNDVFLKNNLVQSGGVGVTGAGKKARLQSGTQVIAANTFVKAPVLELTTGSQVNTTLVGQMDATLLPLFKSNSAPTFNNLTIANNTAPITLPLDSYGNITVGINTTVIFSGTSSVRIRELTLKQGAKVLFDQNTELLINGLMTIGRSAELNAGGPRAVHCFVAGNVSVNTGAKVWANIYTLQDLRLEKATVAAPISMTGQFIANNVYAEDFARWNWDATDCPAGTQQPAVADREEAHDTLPVGSGALRIFPNPAAADTNLAFNLETPGTVTVQIVDAAGNLLQTEQLTGVSGANEHRLRLGKLPGGVYMVQITAGTQQWAKRLVVLRP